MNKVLSPLILAAFLLGTACSGNASLLVGSDFDAGYIAGQTLNGQSGSGDVGLSGSWLVSSTYTGLLTVTNSYDLTYSIAGGGTISGGGNAVLFSSGSSGLANSNALYNLLSRAPSPTITASSVFVRFVIQPIASGPNSSEYFWLGKDIANNKIGSTNADILGLGASNAPRAGGSTTTTGGILVSGANLLVAEYTKDGTGNYNNVSLWVNPAYGDSLTPVATISLSQSLSTITYVGLGVSNVTANNSFVFDSYAVGTTWDDVVVVPEPGVSAYMMACLGLFFVVEISRRRVRRANAGC